MGLKLGTTNVPGVHMSVGGSDYVVYGSETGSYSVDVNADQLNGYSMMELIKFIYPVGSVIQNTTNTNPGTYITGTTWTLKSSVALASENVVGNGQGLSLTDGTDLYGSRGIGWFKNQYGNAVGANTGTGSNSIPNVTVGVPTKSQLGANPQNSGLIANTITIYTWERTA